MFINIEGLFAHRQQKIFPAQIKPKYWIILFKGIILNHIKTINKEHIQMALILRIKRSYEQIAALGDWILKQVSSNWRCIQMPLASLGN